MTRPTDDSALLANLMDTANALWLVLDREGRIVQFNLACELATGHAEHEVLGHPFWERFIAEEEIESVIAVFKALVETGLPSRHVNYWLGKDSRRLIDWSNSALRGPDGRVEYIAAIGVDVTSRQAAETALRRRHRQLLEAERVANIGSWELDLVGNELTWSDEIYRIFEIDPSQFGASYEAFLNLVHPDDREWVNRSYSDSVANRTPYDYVHRLLLTDGRIKYVRERGETDYDETGRPIRSLGTVQDITAQHLTETRLKQTAAVFDNTMEGVMITDPGGHIVAVNPALQRITGYDEAELLGQRPNLLRSNRHDNAFYAGMWATIREHGHWQGEVWNRRKNGELYAQLLSISAVRDDAGQVTHYVAICADISHMKQFEASLERLAHYDVLTDLPNRLLLQSRLAHAIERARRDNHAVAVLFFDLDRFKTINDTLGHPAGDALLQGFAERLRKRVREEDTIARLGGDEFVVVLEQVRQADQAAHVAQDILDLLVEPFTLPSGHEVYVGSSIGIAMYPDDGVCAEDLLKNADAAMYQAKEQGRGAFRFYTAALTEAANLRLHLETELRLALRNRQFILHYQTLHDGDARPVGLEALVRWRHPREGMIPPGRFIPVAEDSGLIVELGEWVLREACSQAVLWRQAGLPALPMSINVSPRQLRQPDLVQQVAAIVRETGMDPRLLELEITESALMDNTSRAEAMLMELRALGIRIAIDDFGTGYSSLAYLKRFPVDRLKIDQSFVRDIPSDRNDMAIAATVIAMGRNLGLEVLAEGVETPAQLDFLREQGCALFQGYLFNRPAAGEAIPALIGAPRP